MLFFIFIILFFLINIFVIAISELKLEIKNLDISSMRQKKIEEGFSITIGLYIKKKTIARLEFNREKMKKIDLKERIKKIDFNKYVKKEKIRKEILQRVKFLGINLEEIDLNIVIDTIDPILTSYATALISSVIGIAFGILIRKYDKDKQKFLVEPMYINKNLITLNLSCIISVKIWNIIKEILNHRKLYFNNLKNTKVAHI